MQLGVDDATDSAAGKSKWICCDAVVLVGIWNNCWAYDYSDDRQKIGLGGLYG